MTSFAPLPGRTAISLRNDSALITGTVSLSADRARRFPVAVLASALAVAVLLCFLGWLLVGIVDDYTGYPRKLELPYPRAQGATPGLPPVRQVVIRIRNRGTAENPEPRIVIGQLVTSDWSDAREELRRIASEDGGRRYRLLVIPDGDALHGWVARELSDLAMLRFRNVWLCTRDGQGPVE